MSRNPSPRHFGRLFACLALTLLAAAAPASRARDPRPLAIIPAMGAVQAGRSLALWAPDLRSVLGFDADGKRTWRLATGDQGGLRDLDVIGGNVLVYAGAEAILVAPDSGKVLGRRPDVVLASPGGGSRGCRVHEEEGACALACECSFQVISCDTLAPLGAPALLPHFEERDADGTPASHCPVFSGGLLGRSGDTVITNFPAATDKAFFAVPEITIARDAKSGAELWRLGAGFFDESLSGVAADGVCYAGSRAGTLTVFDCAHGQILWSHALGIASGGEPQAEAAGDAILVRDGGDVALLDARSGHQRWHVAVPEDHIALLDIAPAARGAVIDRRFGSGIRGARLLKARDGATLGDIPFSKEATRWPRRYGDGWITLTGKQLEAWDAAGKSLGGLGSSAPLSDYVVGDGAHVAAWDANAISLVSSMSTTTRPIADVNERARVIAFEGALGPGRLAALLDGKGPWDPKKPETFGELRLYRVSP